MLGSASLADEEVLMLGAYLLDDDECDVPLVFVLCIDGCPRGMPPPLIVADWGIAPGAVVILWICGLLPVFEDGWEAW